MKICKNCGASIADDTMFCTQCGVKVEAFEEPVKEEAKAEEGKQANETVETNTQAAKEEGQEKDQTSYIYGQQPNYNQQNYSQGSNNQGPYTQGAYNQGAYNQGAYNQGAYNQGAYGGYQQYYSQPNPYDHTAEFSAKDVSDNKVIAMLLYLTSYLGLFVALLAAQDSPYLKFHLRQAIKFMVVDTLAIIVGAVLCFTFIIPLLAGAFIFVMWICKIITFFSICGGKSVEPAIIRKFGFLR